MHICVPKETAPLERRVALTPEGVARLVKSGVKVVVQRGAGESAYYPDGAYADAGARIADDAPSAYEGADLIAKVQRPSLDEISLLAERTVVVCLMQPAQSGDLAARLAERGVSALALELVPRITRAQSMDVLSSQATVAGYKAVLLGASMLGKFLPMLTTAAGSITPSKTFVIGAGVAGLQAIATARRLGAVVSGFDIRPAAREQVQSLGASFVASESVSQSAEDKGGYARAQTQDEEARTLAALAAHIPTQDLVITTAQIPGRPAPRLITDAMVRSMRPGSVIVDVAAETGGNCELTVPGESRTVGAVAVIGPLNLPSTLPMHASQMFGKNVLTLLEHIIKDGALTLDPADEIVGPMLLGARPSLAATQQWNTPTSPHPPVK